MKRVIVYNSTTGFTKQYAEWIAEELGCDTMEFQKASEQTLKNYDQVIYGGSLMAGGIKKYGEMVKMNPNNLVVFAVGMTPDSPELRENLKTQNQLEGTPLFYFRGGVCYEKLGFFARILMKKITKEKTSVDYSDKAAIGELVTYLKAQN